MFLNYVYDILTLSIIFIIIYLFFLYLNKKIRPKIMGIEAIKDLEFVQNILSFVYKDDVMNKLEIVMQEIKDKSSDNTYPSFGNVLPEIESEIIKISNYIKKYEILNLEYEGAYNTANMLIYFIFTYSIILIILNVLYYSVFVKYSNAYKYYFLGFFYSVFTIFIFINILFIIIYILHYVKIKKLISEYLI